MNKTLSSVFLLSLLTPGCGRELSPSDVKAVGVGLTPDEIGPEAEYYGGVIEYDWVEFAGGQLPLALTGLASFSPVGPSLSSFKAPYAMVYGLAFVMDQDLPAPDALLGTFSSPPQTVWQVPAVCEPFSFVNNLADVGNTISFSGEDGTTGIALERTPAVYPPDARDVFSYYFGLETWRSEAQYRWVTGDDPSDPTAMKQEVMRKANFGFGQDMLLNFPGGAPPSTATVGSIPMPLAALGGERTLTLPNRPEGVHMSWTGPRFDTDGLLLSDDEEVSTCLKYVATTTGPTSPEDCLALSAENEGASQMYTGPWDTKDGVLFSWLPPAGASGQETVSITVRFLGPVDRTNESFLEGVVLGDPEDARVYDLSDDSYSTYTSLEDLWSEAQADEDIPSGAQIPQGRRAARVCEDDDDISWVFDDELEQADGSLIPSMQGDATSTVVEVTCTIAEPTDGSAAQFLLTEAQLADAMAYARLHGSGGAIFYFTRSTNAAIQAPPVRDAHGKRRDTSPLLVVSRAVQLGRFWYDL